MNIEHWIGSEWCSTNRFFWASMKCLHDFISALGCYYEGRAWAAFCKHFAAAHHLHKLNVIGHHHKREYQLSYEGSKILCNSLVHNDELSTLTLKWNNLGNKGCHIIANAVTINQVRD